ncbi:MAG: hypothetical protein PHX79_07445 [Sphaerochaetaceae bacterium]|nr:hypothetical protein [Sphaerochaetaceae bacterium]
MKKYCTIILLLCSVFLLIGCGSTTAMTDTDFVVKVSGTEGAAFSGSYMTTTTEGQSESKSVEGTIPAEYNMKGNIVSVSFQKQAEAGDLKVEILQGDEVVAQSETSDAYGVVSVATPSN